jgi:excisionase family DNA binding protein
MTSMKEILTKKEVCDYLRISESVLNKLMKSGELPFIKFERRVVFRRSDIEKFLEEKAALSRVPPKKSKK